MPVLLVGEFSKSFRYLPDEIGTIAATLINNSQYLFKLLALVPACRISKPPGELLSLDFAPRIEFGGRNDLEKIFELYFSTRTDIATGTGHGLFLCKQYVTAHNGEIFAQSDGLGRGATIIVRFPLYKKE